jgi:signal transduction histidine kinase
MAWLLSLERAAASTLQEVLRTRKELHELSGQLVSVQEDERRRISRELHDEVGQVLSAMMLGLGNLRSALKTNDREEALEQVHLIEDMTERNANVVRNISLLLRPTMLDDLGLVPALRWLAREVSRTNRMEVDVSSVDELEDLPEGHRTCVYRVVQEALRNACRHSGGQRVHVSVRMTESQLRIDVQDDGKGFQPSLETGVGILGMEERVARLGGKLRVDSSPGQGTTVHFELPTVAA